MRGLGHEQFFAVGHDRGLYVAQRLAIGYPAGGRRRAVLDGIPIGEALARCDAKFAARWYHWFFFGQTATPGRAVYQRRSGGLVTADAEQMGAEAYADYRSAIHDPQTVHAMMEDYRARLGIDRANDEADRSAERRIGCRAPALG